MCLHIVDARHCIELIKNRDVQLKAKFPGLVGVLVDGTLKPGEANYPRFGAAKVMNAKRAVVLGRLFTFNLTKLQSQM